MMYKKSFVSINEMLVTLCLFGIGRSAYYNRFSISWVLWKSEVGLRALDKKVAIEAGDESWVTCVPYDHLDVI